MQYPDQSDLVPRSAMAGILGGSSDLLKDAESRIATEILDAAINSRFTRLSLAQIARSYAVSIDIVESIAQQLVAENFNSDLEKQKFDSVVSRMKAIESLQDEGYKDWCTQNLAREFLRTPKQLRECYNKALCQQSPVEAMHVSDFKKQHRKPVEWLIRGWIPQGITLLIHSDGGVGKTLFCYQIIESVVSGNAWNSCPVAQGSALLVQVDEPELITAERLDIRGIADNAPLHILSDWQVEGIANLEATVAAQPPRILIIDSVTAINRNSIFSENDTEYARPILQIRDLARRYGSTVILIHHSNAGGESRGTRAIHNSVDEVWGLSLTETNDRLLRVQKTRLGRPPGRYIFSLEDDFSFLYKGEESSSGDGSRVTQEERIRLWLSEDDRRGTYFSGREITEYLGVSPDTVRRCLFELWGRGELERKRPQGTKYYLYCVQLIRTDHQVITPDQLPLITSEPLQEKGVPPTDQVIMQKSIFPAIEKPVIRRSVDQLQLKNPVGEGSTPDSVSDQPSDQLSDQGDQLVIACNIGDIVSCISKATWIRAGSTALTSREIPYSKQKSKKIPVQLLGEVARGEIQGSSEVLSIDSDLATIRNLRSKRISVFALSDLNLERKTVRQSSGLEPD